MVIPLYVPLVALAHASSSLSEGSCMHPLPLQLSDVPPPWELWCTVSIFYGADEHVPKYAATIVGDTLTKNMDQ